VRFGLTGGFLGGPGEEGNHSGGVVGGWGGAAVPLSKGVKRPAES